MAGLETARWTVFGVSTPTKGLDEWAWLIYLIIPKLPRWREERKRE